MKLDWIIERDDVARVKAFFAQHCENSFVQGRIARNLAEHKAPILKEKFWEIHVGCLLSSQQRAGPNGAVARFMVDSPFRLPYEACRNHDDVEVFSHGILKDFGGLRRYSIISREIGANLKFLDDGGWKRSFELLEAVRIAATAENERLAANFFDDNLKGFGPKQSRNLLQWLGLSKFETPIDSRITDWLKKFGFPFKLTAAALADRHYYQLVSGGFQKLAVACGIAPCVLDAAIFASYDGEAWNDAISAKRLN